MNARLGIAAGVAALAFAVAGCEGSSSTPPGSGTAGSTQPPASSTQPPAATTQPTGGSTKPTPKTGQIPKTTTAKPRSAQMGTTVIITPTGFSPQVLLAPLGPSSGKVQSVHLDNFGSPVDSGPIQPGHAWAFNPHAALSIVYHSTYEPSFNAQLQIQDVGNS